MSPDKSRSRRVGRSRSLAVDLRGTAHLVGALTKYLSLAMVVPIAVAIGYRETPVPFLITAVIVGGGGWLLEWSTRGSSTLRAREGFLIV